MRREGRSGLQTTLTGAGHHDHIQQSPSPSSATQIAAFALSAQGEYGIVTELAREHDIRRQQVYDLRERAQTVLEAEFTPTEPDWPGSFALEVTPSDMERTVVALRVVTPASIRDIVEVLPTIYGVG